MNEPPADRGAVDAARREAFRRAFGNPIEEFPDGFGTLPRIDVLAYAPGHARREFYTLITSGMSDRAMAVPAEVGRNGRRTELALYADLPSRNFVELLRTIARMPHAQGSWLGAGHTIPNGDPPQPLFPGSLLCAVLVLETVVAPERDLAGVVAIDGDPLRVLWPVPITAAELALKLEKGTPALLDAFNAKQLSFVLDPGRASLV